MCVSVRLCVCVSICLCVCAYIHMKSVVQTYLGVNASNRHVLSVPINASLLNVYQDPLAKV